MSRGIIVLWLALVLSGAVFAQETLPPEGVASALPIMRPDPETLHKWIEEYETAPREEINPEIQSYLLQAQIEGYGTSLSLLSHIQYTPAERNQGSCGNCWVWAGTGVIEIALDVQNSIHERLSTQFFDSCKTDNFACCGGNLNTFSSWYSATGYAIPWSNTNASFQDGYSSYSCPWASGSTTVPCTNISTTPNYPIVSISPTTINTTDYLSDATPIANIKAVLNSNKAVFFGWWLADNTDWNGFGSFWSDQSETAIWDPDVYCGHTWNQSQGGGHAVVIVGYNDDDPNLTNHYWIVLNSWGTASGNRPNGLFRMKMHMNYNCIMHETGYSDWHCRQFQTLNVTFNTPVRAEIIGTWDSGIWYYNVATSHWTKMYSSAPSGPIAVGDVTVDGKADVISCWPSGLWYQNGATLGWTKVFDIAPNKVAAGDITGDGRAEIIGTWSSGIWYYNVATSNWTRMYSYAPSGPIAVGDVTGDGKADVISCWSSGLWYQNGATLGWTKVFDIAPNKVAAGDITGDGRAEIIGTWEQRHLVL